MSLNPVSRIAARALLACCLAACSSGTTADRWVVLQLGAAPDVAPIARVDLAIQETGLAKTYVGDPRPTVAVGLRAPLGVQTVTLTAVAKDAVGACVGTAFGVLDASAGGALTIQAGCGGPSDAGATPAVIDAAEDPRDGPDAPKCPEGSVDDDARPETPCVPAPTCEAGSALTDGSCQACPSGTFSPGGRAACSRWTDCAAGTYVTNEPSGRADRVCQPCADGYHTTGANQSSCVRLEDCAPGTRETAPATGSTPATCAACAAGTYCPGARDGEQPCAPGTWDHDRDPATRCVTKTDCLAGQQVAAEGNATADRTCAACANGTFSTGKNAAACAAFGDCAPGTSVAAAGTSTSDRSCGACASGTFAAGTNAGACAPWRDCEPGTYVVTSPSAASDRECAPCPSGTLTTGRNEASCQAAGECRAGTRTVTPATATSPAVCEACAAGTYCAGGSAAPATCPPSTWDHDANPATECVARTVCGPGESVMADGNATTDRSCAGCPMGRFSTAQNADACVPWTICASGTIVRTPGSKTTDRTCSPCDAGTYSSTENATACSTWTTCGAGSYVVSPGTAAKDRTCALCAMGTYTAGANESMCLPVGSCAAGTRQTKAPTSTSPAVCEACAAGTYCPGGTAAVQPCGMGNWDHDGSAATACVTWSSCGPGQYVSKAGSATGNRTCAACGQGSFSTSSNVSACTSWTSCPSGWEEATPGSGTSDRTCKKSDGQTCTTAAECKTNACTRLYADEDGDGFGTASKTQFFCGTAPSRPGWVGNTADCCDIDNRVKPMADYQSEPSKCGSFDYDCSNNVDRLYPATCTCGNSLPCMPATVACGSSSPANYFPNVRPCMLTPIPTLLQQLCR